MEDDEAKLYQRMHDDAFVKGDDKVSDSGDESPNEFQLHKLKMLAFSDAVEAYRETAEERFNNLDNLKKIVNRLMKKACTSTAC